MICKESLKERMKR